MRAHATAALIFFAIVGCTPSEPASSSEDLEFTVHAPLLGTDPTPLADTLSVPSADTVESDWFLILTEEVKTTHKETHFTSQVERRVRVRGTEDATGLTRFRLSEAQVFSAPSNPSWIAENATLMNDLQITAKRTEQGMNIEFPDDLAPAIAPHVRAVGLALQMLIPPRLSAEVTPRTTWTMSAEAPATMKRTTRPLGTLPCGGSRCLALASSIALSETVESANDSGRVSASGKGSGQAMAHIDIKTGIPVTMRMDYALNTDMTTRGENAHASTLRQQKKLSATMRVKGDPAP